MEAGGTIMRPRIVYPGQRFGLLTIVREVAKQSRSRCFEVFCSCDPTVTLVVRLNNLVSGNSSSCGCVRVEKAAARTRIHNAWQSAEYDAWIAMKDRCFNPKNGSFEHYGGRGITVCEEWRNSALAFLTHVGPRPSPEHSLDRIDVNGNYEPGNVQWATRKQQARNQRTTRWVTLQGQTRSVAEWSELLGVCPKRIYRRLADGWAEEDAVLKPFVPHSQRKWA
jgi:hypothetical protein